MRRFVGRFQMGYRYRGGEVKVAWDPEYIAFADLDGTVIAIHEHPPAGTTYVSNGVPRGRPPKSGKTRKYR
jgi:putative transposase